MLREIVESAVDVLFTENGYTLADKTAELKKLLDYIGISGVSATFIQPSAVRWEYEDSTATRLARIVLEEIHLFDELGGVEQSIEHLETVLERWKLHYASYYKQAPKLSDVELRKLIIKSGR